MKRILLISSFATLAVFFGAGCAKVEEKREPSHAITTTTETHESHVVAPTQTETHVIRSY